jgi:hypothetical protein
MLAKAITPADIAHPDQGAAPAQQASAGPQLLPLLTFPWKFPRDAAGLSLYFTTMASIVVLMLVFAVVSVVPLTENLAAANFSRTYLLVDPGIPDEVLI